MPEQRVVFQGVTPYLHYDNLASMLDWLTRVFGFIEKGRWVNDSGHVTNAEVFAGNAEIWLDGDPEWWRSKGRRPEEWIGIWVNDVQAMHDRVVEAGVEVAPPEAKFYGVRVLQVRDPEGYVWGFMQKAPYTARAPS